jgi:chorismate mutase
MKRQSELALLESLWKSIKDQLENERQRVYEEIKHYPTPIPACDAQFNYLLEERAKIAQELDRLKALSKVSLARRDGVKLIDEFIMSSNYIKGEVEQRMRSTLLQVSDEGGV